MIVVLLCLQVAFGAGMSQRLGALEVLGPDDMRQIRQIADGRAPWLVVADRGQSLGFWSAEAFLPPAVESAVLRRGTLVVLSTRVSVPPGTTYAETLDRPRTWTLHGQGFGSYAQVTLPGRGFDAIEHERDIIRPFAVEGAFTDQEILAIVGAIRRGAAPDVLEPSLAAYYREWPITGLIRDADGAVAVQRLGPTHSVVVRLTREDDAAWRVLSVTRGLVP